MKTALKVLRHMNVILAMMFGVFLVLDVYNPLMNFVDNGISRALLALWCALTVIYAAIAWAGEPIFASHKKRIARISADLHDDPRPPVAGFLDPEPGRFSP